MDNKLQQTPTNDELTAAAALLEQKRLAAVNYKEARRNQGGDRPPSLGTTTGAATPATGRRDTNPLEEILGALGNRPGKLPHLGSKGCLLEKKPHQEDTIDLCPQQ
jgi:hypothetical protein